MNQFQIEIKQVGEEAFPKIQELANKIWPNTYKNIISEDQSKYMLEMMYSTESLLKQMESGCLFLIIYENAIEVGFASYQIFEGYAKLHKIYLLAHYQGKGYGKALVNEIVKLLNIAKINILILNVNRYNNAKIAYEKMGFLVEKEEDIEIGNGYFMNDYVMKLVF